MREVLKDNTEEVKKEFYLLCKAIKDKTISREMLIAYANSYIESQNLKPKP